MGDNSGHGPKHGMTVVGSGGGGMDSAGVCTGGAENELKEGRVQMYN